MRLKAIRRRLRYWVLRLVLTPLAHLPRRWGLGVFAGLGTIAWALLPRTRRLILLHTRFVHPRWTERECGRFARRVLQALGRNAFDFIRLHRYSQAELRALVTIEGLEHLQRARRPGIGVICLGAHLGCWELIPHRLKAEGFEVAVVYRRLGSPELQTYVAQRREQVGIETLERDGDVRAMVRGLRRGALLGMLIDQRTQVDSVWVPFLGRPAWTPTGPVRLAMRTGAPVVTMVAAMLPGCSHALMIGPKVAIETPPAGAPAADVAACIERNVARCNEALGAAIAPWEEQWVWFHRRWRAERA